MKQQNDAIAFNGAKAKKENRTIFRPSETQSNINKTLHRGSTVKDIFSNFLEKDRQNIQWVTKCIWNADNIQIVDYVHNGAGHDRILCRVFMICRKENMKLNKDKCYFRHSSVPIFGEIISKQGVRPDPRNLKALTGIQP